MLIMFYHSVSHAFFKTTFQKIFRHQGLKTGGYKKGQGRTARVQTLSFVQLFYVLVNCFQSPFTPYDKRSQWCGFAHNGGPPQYESFDCDGIHNVRARVCLHEKRAPTERENVRVKLNKVNVF